MNSKKVESIVQKSDDISVDETARETMNIVVVGHVDHGKSTIVGRLLADTNSLPEGKLAQVKSNCQRNSKPFEYAFLIDALKDEQTQGITIDSARVFFKTNKRDYIIIDAPGHIEFLKNMVTGSSRAEAALLVIDAKEGVQENSRRHGYMLSMLGIKQIVVLVNKMDCVSYRKDIFERIVEEYSRFLLKINISPVCFIPVSGREGDNIVAVSAVMSWYKATTVLGVLDFLKKEKTSANQVFRMPIQGVYKFTKCGDTRRIVAGTIESGTIKVGDNVIFYPSGKKNKVKTIEAFNKSMREESSAGYAVGLTLSEQSYIKRGEIIVKENEEAPQIASRIKVNLFWLGKKPMVKRKDYIFKLGTEKVLARLEKIERVIDASNLKSVEAKEEINRHDVAECILKLKRAISFDLVDKIVSLSRFVIVADYEISGGGIIREALPDGQSWVREKVFMRNCKWEKSNISQEERAEKYNQKSAVILVTGAKDVGKKRIAKKLEASLFSLDRFVYFLGIGNVLYGVDADIKGKADVKQEHIRRLAEVSNILIDSGMILIVPAIELTQDNLNLIKTSVNIDRIITIWVGGDITTDIEYDLRVDNVDDLDNVTGQVKRILKNKGIIFDSAKE
ncbi:MAG: GTP-binding protein [Candidatus Omnitrophota bacterium]|nr:adenylyl-sulfate kinase [Candidatus Omnitrophota bacterium]